MDSVEWLRKHASELQEVVLRHAAPDVSGLVAKTLNNIEQLRKAADELEKLRRLTRA